MSNLQEFGKQWKEADLKRRLQDASGVADVEEFMSPTPSVSTYVPPVYDQGRLGELTQELASPGLRRLRGVTREGIMGTQQRFDNPAAQGVAIRRLLSGYGQGLEDVIGGARTGATSAYAQEYAPMAEAAKLNWTAEEARKMDEWNKRMALNAAVLQNRLGEISALNRFGEQWQLMKEMARLKAGEHRIIPSAGMMSGYYAPPSATPSTSGYWGNVSMSPRFQEPVFKSPSDLAPKVKTAEVNAGAWSKVKELL